MYCDKCGKKLADGEVCSCKKSEETVVVSAAEQSPLPETKKLAEGVKAIGSNPVVTDLVSVIKGAFTAPVKQTGKCAKRTDILWIILAAVEALITSVCVTVVVRHLTHFVLNSVSGAMGSKTSFGDFAKSLAAMDAGVWKTFGLALLGVLIIYILVAGLIFALSAIYKRKISLASVCNMLVTANIPSTALILAALIFGWIYVPISLPFIIGASASILVLCYMGMQKLGEGKFTSSPFWAYIICAVIIFAVSSFIAAGFAGIVFDDIASRFTSLIF